MLEQSHTAGHNAPALPPEIARRRTFAIISHPDAGKTTLTEKFLLYGGAIQMAGQVRAKGEARRTRSDFMKMEQERGISVSASAMSFPFGERWFNLVDTPGHAGLLRGHLPHPDRGRRRHHGDRRRQGRREPDPQAVRGLPAARPADPHLLQQDGPREPRDLRDHRRDPGAARPRRHPRQLAHRPGPRLHGRLRPDPRPGRADEPGRAQRQGAVGGDRGARRPEARRADPRPPRRQAPRGGRDGPRAAARLRPAKLPRGPHDADLVRLGAELVRGARADAGHRRLRAAAAAADDRDPPGGRRGDAGHRLRLQGAGQHGPQAPGSCRLRAALQRPLHARHEAEACARRQADGDLQPGAVPRRRARAGRGRLGRRHHRHPQPRPAPHRRRPDRGRGPALHRHPRLRARAVCRTSAPPTR